MKPVKPLPVRKKLGELSQAELYVLVKNSTERNRQLFFVWIAFALYVIVATAATTDLQLLLPNSTVTLPALGIQLPLIGFFIVTPWLVLILHFNLLKNLDSHAYKLMQWADSYQNQSPPRAALPAFLFDFAMLEQGATFSKLTQIATQLVFYAAGPITIGILLWRFSDYQSWRYSLSQLVAFLANGYFVVKAISALKQKHRFSVAISPISYFLVYVPTTLIVLLEMYWVLTLAFSNNKPWLFDKDYSSIWLPQISVPRYSTLVYIPHDIQAKMLLDGESKMKKWWNEYGRGVDLSNRNLKYAILDEIDLRKGVFNFAELQGADLSRSQLQGADFRLANLQDVDFSLSQLEGVDFRGAILTQTNLHNINLNLKTNFSHTQFDSPPHIFIGDNLNSDDVFPNGIAINMEQTFKLRENMRDLNGLQLPDSLYNQLFITETKYALQNEKEEVKVSVGLGFRIAEKK